jgi:hypothetical protein
MGVVSYTGRKVEDRILECSCPHHQEHPICEVDVDFCGSLERSAMAKVKKKASCLVCKKEMDVPVVCSGCKCTVYCSADCQKFHWKDHKVCRMCCH